MKREGGLKKKDRRDGLKREGGLKRGGRIEERRED